MRLATGTLPRQKHVCALLAEDDAVLRRRLKTHLAAWGLTVIEAHDRAHLAEVMAVMRKDPGAGIDVIVSELQMLGMGCGEIRSRLHQFHAATPMIVLYGSSDHELAGEAAREGAVVFGKPFDIDDLGTAVVNAVVT
jgi:DNA-binding NtrC family response regulator